MGGGVKRVLDIPGLWPSLELDLDRGVKLWARIQRVDTKTLDKNGYEAYIYPYLLARRLRGEKPYDVMIITGPLGVKRWLGVPYWVRLYVWPDDYEVMERIEPVEQELIWLGLTKLKARQVAKKPPKTNKSGTLDLLSQATKRASQLWAPPYQSPPESIQFTSGQETVTALDWETDGRWKYDCTTTGLGLATGKDSAFVGYYLDPDGVAEQERHWREGIKGKPVFHNASFDIGVGVGKGWGNPTDFDDTYLLAFCAGEKHRDDRALLNLKHLASKYLGVDYVRELEDILPQAELKRTGTLKADRQALAEYCKTDARATLALLPILKRKAVSKIYELEKRVMPVVMEMERTPFKLDSKPLLVAQVAAQAGMLHMREYLRKAGFGCECDVGSKGHKPKCGGNLASPAQVQAFLFDRLGLRASRRSTDKDLMENELKGQHPAVMWIRASRILSDLYDEAQGLLDMQGKGYPTFNQAGASTGRFSSGGKSGPFGVETNWQNKRGTLRKAFVTDEPDKEWVYRADYAQLELRIAAGISGDRNMLRAIREGKSLHKDLHTFIESKGIRVAYVDVKRFDFSLFYGADIPRVKSILKCDEDKAKAVIGAVEEGWPEALAYRRVWINEAREAEQNETMDGRIRKYPYINSSDYVERGHAERTAVNFPIQGTAADIMKKALIEVPALHKKYGGVMRLTVHDEVVGTVPKENAEEFKRDLHRAMTEVEPRIPLDVEIGFGSNWAEAKPK